jgi:hypothetical protein
MNFETRQSVYTNLRDYCHMAKPDVNIEVCGWINGEGWDISIDERIVSLTYGELDAINVLTKIKHPEK